jgi:hypothetical protein
MKKEIKKELCELWKYTLEFFKLNKYYIFWFFIFCLLFTICFCFGQRLNSASFNEYFGTFGDFIGGVLGTLFALISVAFMKKTFESQREESKDQRNYAAIQRFNNLFFELLRVYQENVKELGGKQFFNEQQQKIQKEEYEKIKQYNNYKYRELNWYIPFYVKNRSKLAPYFRTLYRMFEVLENNEKLLGDKSKEYAKIIRAQLSESELFFIRVNVYSMYGVDFVDYINKYRIFKHLPFCDLPEYPDVWGWDLELKEGINLTYLTIYEAINNKFKEKDELPKLFEASKRYKFTFNLNKEKTEFKIKLEINKNIGRDYREFKWIEKCRSNEEIKNMLDKFIKEIFYCSNFGKFNEKICQDGIIEDKKNKVTIIRSIKSIKGEPEPLRIKYDHNQKDD